MKRRAVLFDLDGTLLDTLEDLADSVNSALAGLGLPTHPAEAYRYFVGDGRENTVVRALPHDRRDEATVKMCVAAMNREYNKTWANKTRPYDGVTELLGELAERGLKQTILSNKPEEFTQLTVARLLPHWRFDAVVGARPAVPLKPDPTAALAIAADLGVAPAAFLYLGDTDTDMQTACAAGMYPVGALWGFRAAEELTANGARSLIERPVELLELL